MKDLPALLNEGFNKINKKVYEVNEAWETMPISDLIHGYVQVSLAAAPFYSGPQILGLWAFGYGLILNMYQYRRVYEATHDLGERIKAIENRIDKDKTNPEEYLWIIQKTVEQVKDVPDGERIKLYRNVLLNALYNTNLSFEKKEHLVLILGSLSTLHIRFMSILYDSQNNFSKVDYDQGEILRKLHGAREPIWKLMTNIFPEVSEDQCKGLAEELMSKGLIKAEAIRAQATITYSMSRVYDAMSPFGKLFCDFIMTDTSKEA